MIGKGSGLSILLFCLCFVTALSSDLLAAKNVKVETKLTPSTAVVGDELNLTVSVSGRISEVTKPYFELPEGLTVRRSEPSISQSLEIIIGEYSRSVEFSYTIRCKTKGSYTIKAPSVEADGQLYKGNPVKLRVVKAGEAKTSGGSIRLEARVLPKEAFVGQSVALLVRLYVPRRVIGNGRWGWVEKPSGKGFLPEAIGDSKSEWKLVNLGGVPTMVLDLARYVATPTQAGTYRFNPGTAKVVVRVPKERRRRRRPRSLFDSFFDDDFDSFFGRMRGKEVAVGGEAVEFKLKELPQRGRPEDFSGICASDLSAEAEVSRRSLKEHESLTFKVILRGRGDLRSMKAPELESSEDFRVFESKSKASIFLSNGALRSKVVFEYVLVPTRSGKLSLPSLSFDYFDTEGVSYEVARTKPVELEVKPGKKEEIVQVSKLPMRKEHVRLRGRDINYIHESREDSIPLSEPPLHDKPLYWVLTLFPLVFLLGEGLYRRYTSLSAGDLRLLRASRALSKALSGINQCRAEIDDGKSFYSKLRLVLLQYLADKLDRSPSGLVFSEIRSDLQVRGMPEELLDDFSSLLEQCEAAAFSPALPGNEEREKACQQAVASLKAMDGRWSS